MCSTCLTHLIFLDLIILIIFGEEYNYEVPNHAIFSSFLSLPLFYILASTLLLRSSLDARDEVSHPYKPAVTSLFCK
jgi:hypothetical protein